MNPPIIISVVNHKGGVLKTGLTVNLAAGLAQTGKRVLVVDLDMQQDLTKSLVNPQTLPEIGNVFSEYLLDKKPLNELIVQTGTDGLDLLPSDEEFITVDLGLVSMTGRENVLKTCLSKTASLSEYDFVFLDNPPSLSLVVVNSLVASDYFLIPLSAEFLPMTGLLTFGRTIGDIRPLNPYLDFLGAVITMFNAREAICHQIEKQIRSSDIGPRVFDTKIRVNTKGKSCQAVQQTFFQYENSKKGRSTQDFTALTAEFIERLEAKERESTPVAING